MERAPQTLVIDASVTVKWFVDERDTAKALAVRNRHIAGELELVAPDLIVYETLNAISEYPGISRNLLRSYVDSLFGLDLDLAPPSSEQMAKTTLNAKELKISVYDSSYVTLAEYLSTLILTADEKLARRIGGRKALLLKQLDDMWSLP